MLSMSDAGRAVCQYATAILLFIFVAGVRADIWYSTKERPGNDTTDAMGDWDDEEIAAATKASLLTQASSFIPPTPESYKTYDKNTALQFHSHIQSGTIILDSLEDGRSGFWAWKDLHGGYDKTVDALSLRKRRSRRTTEEHVT
jgi:hypothetical protein